MAGLFSALGTGARALLAHQGAVRVAGHNISNASTEGYSRQRVNLQASTPEDLTVGIIGRGVDLKSIDRLTDEFVDRSLRKGSSELKSLDVKQSALKQAEGVYQELSDNDLSTALTKFFTALDSLADRPEDMAVRRTVVDQAKALSDSFQALSKGLNGIRKSLNDDVATTVGKVNSLITDLADLNKQIVQSEFANASGSRNANDLRDARDLKLKQLAELVDITTAEQSDGQVNVFVAGDPLVMQNRPNTLTTSTSTSNGITVTNPVFANNNGPLILRGGRLEGLVTSRDTTIPKYLTDLNTLAAGVILEVNKLHAQGIGLTGFSSVTGAKAVTSASAALNAAGLDFTPVNGSFQVNVTNRNTGSVTTTNIQVDLDGIAPADTTLNSLTAAIDAVANISASVTSDNKLKISADSTDYTITFTSDTSRALACLGINTLFTGKDSTDIGVNSVVDGDLSKLSAALTPAAGDNANAVAMANLRTTAVLNSNTTTLEEFYRGSVGTLAVESQQKSSAFATQQLRNDRLENERQQVSGVNVDEEMIKLMEFQRAYQGSARFVAVVDEMLDTLVNHLF